MDFRNYVWSNEIKAFIYDFSGNDTMQKLKRDKEYLLHFRDWLFVVCAIKTNGGIIISRGRFREYINNVKELKLLYKYLFDVDVDKDNYKIKNANNVGKMLFF